MKYIRITLILLVALEISGPLSGCTTFIVSGRFTPDGKPILYKHRDTGTLDNALAWFNDGKYPYIAVVNGNSRWASEVWGGYNSAGFAIMNSVAYNMNTGDTTTYGDQEGEIMKMALMYCATVDDFEKLLNDLPKPLGADANFGVIDALGGAAYFETGNFHYKKIDANDPATAPYGYLIRTNHAFSGSSDRGAGYIRYAAAEKVLFDAAAAGRYEPQYLLNSVSRNLTHSLTGANLAENLVADDTRPEYRFFEDFIPRISSASAFMIVGAGKERDPLSTTMWTILGFPLTTVTVPVWLTGDGALPLITRAMADFHAPLCDAALEVKSRCFPITRGSGKKYIDISKVINTKRTGSLQLVREIEKPIFEKALSIIPEKGKSRDENIKKYYQWLDDYIAGKYLEMFNVKMAE